MKIILMVTGLFLFFTSCRKENDLFGDLLQKNNKYSAKKILRKEIDTIQPALSPGNDSSTADYNTYSYTLNISNFIYNTTSNSYYINLALEEGPVNENCQLEVFLKPSADSLNKLPFIDLNHNLDYSYSLQGGGIHLTISIIENQYQKKKHCSALPELINYEIHVRFDGDEW